MRQTLEVRPAQEEEVIRVVRWLVAKGQAQEARSALVEPTPDPLEVLGREAS